MNPKLLAIGLLFSIPTLAPAQGVIVRDKKFSVSISETDIKEKVSEVASAIRKDYSDKNPIFIGVLNGAFIFMADLVRAVDIDCEMDFIKISSYGNQTRSSGSIKLSKDVSLDLNGRHVIIVEDIIETGRSIKFVKELLAKHNPTSISVATLLHKNVTELETPIDYLGFSIAPEFVIGYGLDFAQAGRALKDIHKLTE